MSASIRLYGSTTEHVFPHLIVQNPSVRGAGAFLQFEGRSRPVGFRGTHKRVEWSLEAVYSRLEHDQAADLLDLLATAFNAEDGRLTLSIDGAKDNRINGEFTIEVHEWSQRREGGGILYVEMQAIEVEG